MCRMRPLPPGFMQVSAALGEAEQAAASAKQQRGMRVPPHVLHLPPGSMQVSAALGEAERAAASARQQRGLREAEVAAARAASSSGGTPSTGTAPSRTVSGAVHLGAVVGSMP